MLSFKEYLTEKVSTTAIDTYHGSGKFFHQFDQKHARLANDFYGGGVGYFTDNKDIAHSYARGMSKETKTPHVYHTSLHLSNVFDVDHEFHGEKLKKILPKDTEKFANAAGLIGLHNHEQKYSILSKLENGEIKMKGHEVFRGLSHGMTNTAKARDHLIKHGYDGLRYNGGMNMQQATQHNVYIPYKADSIKIKKVEKI